MLDREEGSELKRIVFITTGSKVKKTATVLDPMMQQDWENEVYLAIICAVG